MIGGTRAGRGCLVGLLVLLVAGACRDAGPSVAEVPASEPAVVELLDFDFGGDFALTGHDGQAVRLSDFEGRAVLLFFGFTACPNVCPITMSKIARALAQVEGATDQAHTLFVSVDVDRDTPAVLRDYVSSFDIPADGLTGSQAAVDAVVEQYRASYTITPAASGGAPTVSHSTYTYLIDPHGRLRYVFRHADPPETLAAALRAVLADGA